MDIRSVLIPTIAIKSGMIVKDVFTECGLKNIHALPFVDEEGKITGRLTLKNIMEISCLPTHMVEYAHLLGNQLPCVEHSDEKVHEILNNPVEPYVLPISETLPSTVPLLNALAIMGNHDTSYIFIVDDGVYKGIVSIQGIAKVMSEMELEHVDAYSKKTG